MQGRKASVIITYNGKNVTTKLSEFLESFSYTDVASGESDSISIKLSNIDKKWLGAWFPAKGDKLTVSTKLVNWSKKGEKKFKCGEFTLDEFSFSGRPLVADLGALSLPINESFKTTERNKTYKKVTIEEIAKEIAKRANVKLVYDAARIDIETIEQSQNDCDFLYDLCEKYGLGMKVYSLKIIIFDESKYEKKRSVTTINETDMNSWSYDTSTNKTYTAAKISYTNPKTKKDVSITVGEGKRVLKISEKADSKADAEKIAKAKINNANKKMTTMRITIQANPKIVATSNVTIKGLGKLNGKYAVDKVVHSIGSGYTMTLTLRLIQNRIGEKTNKVYASGKNTNYIVKQGDTLWAISKTFYGTPTSWKVIYEANKEVIESTAKKHGKANSSNGNWLWPGTGLVIPIVEES